MWNLNEDPFLSGRIVHFTHPGITTIGSDENMVVVIKGLGFVLVASYSKYVEKKFKIDAFVEF